MVRAVPPVRLGGVPGWSGQSPRHGWGGGPDGQGSPPGTVARVSGRPVVGIPGWPGPAVLLGRRLRGFHAECPGARLFGCPACPDALLAQWCGAAGCGDARMHLVPGVAGMFGRQELGTVEARGCWDARKAGAGSSAGMQGCRDERFAGAGSSAGIRGCRDAGMSISPGRSVSAGRADARWGQLPHSPAEAHMGCTCCPGARTPGRRH